MYVPQTQRNIMKSALEMAVMESLRHPHCVRVFAVLPDMIEEMGEPAASHPRLMLQYTQPLIATAPVGAASSSMYRVLSACANMQPL